METFSFKHGIRKFVQKGYEATYGEMLNLHQRRLFKAIKVSYSNPREIKRAL